MAATLAQDLQGVEVHRDVPHLLLQVQDTTVVVLDEVHGRAWHIQAHANLFDLPVEDLSQLELPVRRVFGGTLLPSSFSQQAKKLLHAVYSGQNHLKT